VRREPTPRTALPGAAARIAGGLVAVVTFASCASSGPHDLVGRGGEALAATDSVRALAAQDEQPLEPGLEPFLNLFADFEPQAVEARARAVYAPRAYFNDGLVELEGVEEIAAYLGRTAGLTTELEVDVEHVVSADGEIYLRWVMRFTTAGSRATTIIAPGVTHLRLDGSGRIVYHRDHWDGSGALAELVPGVGRVLRWARSRL
jgi:limonene-1,2-epoxide hydrolase